MDESLEIKSTPLKDFDSDIELFVKGKIAKGLHQLQMEDEN